MVMLFKRKRQMRLVGLATITIAALVGWRLWANGVADYVPGTAVDGLTDSLARRLPSDRPAVAFTDVTKEAGLVFRHFPAVRSNKLPEDMGSGVALGDIDGDGWTDVYAVNLTGSLADLADDSKPSLDDGRCRMFRNRGDGTFEDITDASGTGLSVMGMAAAFADIDGDGDLDLIVTSYGLCSLFVNDGSGHFVDRSESSGVGVERAFWAGLAVADYDGDNDVDLYITGYVRFKDDSIDGNAMASQYATDIPAMINPSAFEPQRNLLLRNRGDGTFEEVAEAAGVADHRGRGLGAVFADLSGDGLLDLYVANDVSDNVLYLNNGDGTFSDLTARALVGDYRGAMGLAVSDFDNDLDLDLFITHWVAQENALYVNITSDLAQEGQPPTMMFMDEADRSGLGHVALHKVGWATRFFDFDNDGERDLFIVNGSTIPLSEDKTQLEPMVTQLFWNGGEGRGFYELGPLAGPFFEQEVVGRGGATFDYDRDGDEDLLIMVHGQGLVLLKNETPSGNSLRVQLRQADGNRFALGAQVTVRTAGQAWTDQIGTDGSYLSQHAVGEVSFGLGDEPTVETLEVTWPDGVQETFGPLPSDRMVSWVRGQQPVLKPHTGGAAVVASKPTDSDSLRRFYALKDDGDDARLAGEADEALKHYRSALMLWPGHDHCTYYLANTLREVGLEAQALAALTQLVADIPRSSRAWMQLGRIRLPGGDLSLDDLAAAEAAFAQAHQINGEESGPVVQLGVVHLLQGELAEADKWLAAAAASNSRSVEATYYRGYIAWLGGDNAGAAQHLADARQLSKGPDTGSSSVSSEGQTRSGQALTAKGSQNSDDALARWSTLLNRDADADVEYASLQQQLVH